MPHCEQAYAVIAQSFIIFFQFLNELIQFFFVMIFMLFINIFAMTNFSNIYQ